MTRPVVIFAGAAALAAVLVAASLLGSRTSAQAPSTSVLGASETEALLRGIPQDGIALGSPAAPVTLVEYADLQCPYCAQWARDAFPAIIDEYVRPGRVRILFRGLAFIGPESETALRTALAAGGHGRLWNVVHLLYANQGAENGGWVTEDLLEAVAAAVPGLEGDEMLAQRTSGRVASELEAAVAAARRAQVPGTPFFQAGPTGGPLTSLGPDEVPARLDALLAG